MDSQIHGKGTCGSTLIGAQKAPIARCPGATVWSTISPAISKIECSLRTQYIGLRRMCTEFRLAELTADRKPMTKRTAEWGRAARKKLRSEEHTSELQSL